MIVLFDPETLLLYIFGLRIDENYVAVTMYVQMEMFDEITVLIVLYGLNDVRIIIFCMP